MKKIHNIEKEITVFAPKDEVWNLFVNKFGDVNNFNPLIIESHALDNKQGEVGCERHCTIDTKRSVVERITGIRGKESFDVEIVEGGLPMMDEMRVTINFKEIEREKTIIKMDFKFNTSPGFLAPLLKGMMGKQLDTLMVGAKYHLETSGLVSKENIKSIMDNYKDVGEQSHFESVQQESVVA